MVCVEVVDGGRRGMVGCGFALAVFGRRKIMQGSENA